MTAPSTNDPIEIPLRWADADAYGHVHHAMFLTLAEHARILWLSRVFGSDPIFDHANVHLSIDYREELLVEHGPVLCFFQVEDVGSTSIRLREQMEAPAGRVVAELTTVIAAWIPSERRKRKLTDQERAVLRELNEA